MQPDEKVNGSPEQVALECEVTFRGIALVANAQGVIEPKIVEMRTKLDLRNWFKLTDEEKGAAMSRIIELSGAGVAKKIAELQKSR
jgi:hypothetical protein